MDEFIVEDMIEILKGLCDCYEVYYRINILDEVLEVVVKLSDCYVLDCFLLDKVIDLIDEVSLKVRFKSYIMLSNLKEIE